MEVTSGTGISGCIFYRRHAFWGHLEHLKVAVHWPCSDSLLPSYHVIMDNQ